MVLGNANQPAAAIFSNLTSPRIELPLRNPAIIPIRIEAADTIPFPFRLVKSATIKTVPAIVRWCQFAKISGLLFINHTPPPAYLNPTLSKAKSNH